MSGRRARLVRMAYAGAPFTDREGDALRIYRQTARHARSNPMHRRTLLALAVCPSDLYPERTRPEWLTLRRDRRHDGQAPDAG